jgi:hypothetical protein
MTRHRIKYLRKELETSVWSTLGGNMKKKSRYGLFKGGNMRKKPAYGQPRKENARK